MERITKRHLESTCKLLNRTTGQNPEPYTRNKAGKYIPNSGTFYISSANSGHHLEQMDGPGSRNVLHCGYTTPRELYNLIHAYILGIELKAKL